MARSYEPRRVSLAAIRALAAECCGRTAIFIYLSYGFLRTRACLARHAAGLALVMVALVLTTCVLTMPPRPTPPALVTPSRAVSGVL